MNYRPIIESKYNRKDWQSLLYDIFKNRVEFYSTPQPVDVDASIARGALYTGKITLPDGYTLAIYEVELADNVNIERNRTGIRNLLCSNWKGLFAGAFMFCYRQNESVLRFSYVSESFKFAEDGTLTKESTDTKRFTYLLGEGHRSRTADEQFRKLHDSDLTLKDITKAFSVEAISDAFFKGYKKQYEDIIEFVTGKRMVKKGNKWEESYNGHPNIKIMQEFSSFSNAEKAVRDYVKKLMGRLVFIQFLQKKGWMGCSAGDDWNDGDREFVQNLFENTNYKHTFVDDVLEPLFADLNNRRDGDIVSSPKVGANIKVPYLNGGLFEMDECDKAAFPLPAEYMKNLLDFFSSYNFTIDENDPDDAEIGVDPEMLGRIFENLLEDNKDKGAFYTPKEIVHYMCRESLIAYLQTGVADDIVKNSIRQFVTEHDASLLPDAIKDSIDVKLKEVKICDPAIGSGAFPMGLLRELYACRKAIEGIDDEKAVSIKTHIIENNIYGVDIEKGAVDIARLRFWLALIVDEVTPHALPNMDFKIMQGNSLLEQYEGIDLSGMSLNERQQQKAKSKKKEAWQQELAFDDSVSLNNIQSAIKEYYKTEDHAHKESLRHIINTNVKSYIVNFKACTPEIKAKIENLPIPNDQFFLWHIYFKEVFDKGGFDIVIGNPPYIEFKNLSKDIKETLTGYMSAQGKYDLYIPFMEMGLKLTKQNGVTTYICPTRFMMRDYGKGIRDYIRDNVSVISILNFADYQVFDNAMTYTGVFMFRNVMQPSYKFKMFRYNVASKSLMLNKMTLLCDNFDSNKLSNNVWNFIDVKLSNLCSKIKEGSIPMNDVCRGIYQGIASGKDDVFFVDNKVIELYKLEREILHPILKGKDIGPYVINWSEKFVIYPYHDDGTVINEANLASNYPNVYKYLLDCKHRLSGRGYFEKSSKQWYELWNQRNLNRFKDEKIITLDNASENSFTYDNDGFLGTTTVYSLVVRDIGINIKYMLGLLNSKVLNFYHKNNSIPQAGGFYRYQAIFIKDIPIRKAEYCQQRLIINLVDKILLAKKQTPLSDTSALETEIDQLVYKLYALSPDEIAIIENSTK